MNVVSLILLNSIGVLLIAAIIWWFWLSGRSKPVVHVKDRIDIKVGGGVYSPDAIQVKRNNPITLRFLRKEENPCAATVVFADFNASLDLPLDEWAELKITPEKAGEFEFTCQMGMYRGKLIVTD